MLGARTKALPHDLAKGDRPHLPKPGGQKQKTDKQHQRIGQIDNQRTPTRLVDSGPVTHKGIRADAAHENTRPNQPPGTLGPRPKVIAGILVKAPEAEPDTQQKDQIDTNNNYFEAEFHIKGLGIVEPKH